VDEGTQSGGDDLRKMQTLGNSNQPMVATEMAILNLTGLCSNFSYIYLPDVLTVQGWLHEPCSGSKGHVYSLASL